MLTLAGTFSTSMPEPGLDTGVVGYSAGDGASLAATREATIGAGLMVRGAVRAGPDLGFGAVGETTMGGKP
jgi:hypothetical protein